ncbi:MAG: hypothetical protein AAB483_03905 [Patescibacteria group bacterium]
MQRFREIKRVAEAASAAGLPPEETRKIVDGSLFSESDRGLLGILKNSLQDSKRRGKLLDILESRTQNPVPLSEIITVFDKFSHLQEKLRGEITPADIRLLQFTVKYFENWFYRGAWVKLPERAAGQEDENPYAYFSVPAGLLNLLTKIKEMPEYSNQLGSFDRGRLSELQAQVRSFATGLLSKTQLDNRQAMITTFTESERSVSHELGPRGHEAGDLYFLKTCIVAAEMLRRQRLENPDRVFTPDAKMATPRNEYVLFDFSAGKASRYNSMHYPTFRLPYCKFVVEYLRRSTR